MSSYDLILEVSEEFINRSLRQFNDTGVIQQVIEGKYYMNMPSVLKVYSEIDYKVSLIEPLEIDAISENMIMIQFAADVKLRYNIINLESRVKGIIESKPVYNRGSNQLELDVKEVTLNKVQVFNVLDLPNLLVKTINDTIHDIVKHGLGEIDNIPLSPIVGSLELPEMPQGNKYLLPVGFGRVNLISNNVVSLGFDIAAPGTGDKIELLRSVLKSDIAVIVSQSALNKTVDFWWKYTTHQKVQPFRSRIKIQHVEQLVDYLSNYSIEIIPKLLTLGFIELDWDLVDIWLDYEGVVKLSKPVLSLEKNFIGLKSYALLDMTAFLRVELDVALEFDTSGPIPDFVTPWKDDRVIGQSKRRLDVMRFRLDKKQIELDKIDVSLFVDDARRIVCKMDSFDLELGLNWRLPRRVINRLERRIEMEIMAAFPMVPISSSVVSNQVQGTELVMELNIKNILHRKGSIIVHSDVVYS